MAYSSFKCRDQQRFAKIYPFTRSAKSISVRASGTETLTYETGKVTFTSTDTGTAIFINSYSSAPPVVATAVDTLGNNEANVNVFISSITLTQVTFTTSEIFTGEVHFQILEI